MFSRKAQSRISRTKSVIKSSLLVIATSAILQGGETALAVLLPTTGGTGTPTGTFSLAGETLIPADTMTNTYSHPLGHGLVFDFSLTTQVYANPNTGGLDFVYQVTNTGPNNATADTFERLTVNSYSSFATDVDYVAATGLIGQPSPNLPIPGDVPAMEVDRSTDGSVVGFELLSPLTPTSETDLFVVRTSGTQVTLGSASLIDGFTGSVVTEVPFGTQVRLPEPTSLGIVAVSMGLLARRRRICGK
jgi:hypothetical protein